MHLNIFSLSVLFVIGFICGTSADYSAETEGHHEGQGPSEIQHTLMPPFLHSEYDNEFWDFGGNTVVRVYDYVRLTSAQPNQNGWIWSKQYSYIHSSIDD